MQSLWSRSGASRKYIRAIIILHQTRIQEIFWIFVVLKTWSWIYICIFLSSFDSRLNFHDYDCINLPNTFKMNLLKSCSFDSAMQICFCLSKSPKCQYKDKRLHDLFSSLFSSLFYIILNLCGHKTHNLVSFHEELALSLATLSKNVSIRDMCQCLQVYLLISTEGSCLQKAGIQLLNLDHCNTSTNITFLSSLVKFVFHHVS